MKKIISHRFKRISIKDQSYNAKLISRIHLEYVDTLWLIVLSEYISENETKIIAQAES